MTSFLVLSLNWLPYGMIVRKKVGKIGRRFCSNYMFEECNRSKNAILFQLYVRRLCSKIAIVQRMKFCSNFMFEDYVRRLQSFDECIFLNMSFEQKVCFDHYLSNTKLEHVFLDQPCSRDIAVVLFYEDVGPPPCFF